MSTVKKIENDLDKDGQIIFDRLAKKFGSKSKVAKLVDSKITELSGFINTVAAIHIIAKENAVKVDYPKGERVDSTPSVFTDVGFYDKTNSKFVIIDEYKKQFATLELSSSLSRGLIDQLIGGDRDWLIIGNDISLSMDDKKNGVFLRRHVKGGSLYFVANGFWCYLAVPAFDFDDNKVKISCNLDRRLTK